MSKFIKKHLKLIYRSKENDFDRDNYLNLERNENTDEIDKNVLNSIKKINFSKKIKTYPSLNESYKLIAREFNIEYSSMVSIISILNNFTLLIKFLKLFLL